MRALGHRGLEGRTGPEHCQPPHLEWRRRAQIHPRKDWTCARPQRRGKGKFGSGVRRRQHWRPGAPYMCARWSNWSFVEGARHPNVSAARSFAVCGECAPGWPESRPTQTPFAAWSFHGSGRLMTPRALAREKPICRSGEVSNRAHLKTCGEDQAAKHWARMAEPTHTHNWSAAGVLLATQWPFRWSRERTSFQTQYNQQLASRRRWFY